MRHVVSMLGATTLTAACFAAAAVGASDGWVVVKRGAPAPAGQIAFVGTIVRSPSTLGVRATAAPPHTVKVLVVLSCRTGLGAAVGKATITARAPFTKSVRLPARAPRNCAISASSRNASGTLRLDILRGG